MQELTTTGSLVEYGTLESRSPVTAVLARSELEAALDAGESSQLWFELVREDDEQAKLLTIDMVSGDLEEMLRRSTGDEIMLALDETALEGLFDDADVEAHGMRGALAVAVAAAAIVAPASLAAKAQVSGVAAKSQISRSLVVRASGLRLLGSGLIR